MLALFRFDVIQVAISKNSRSKSHLIYPLLQNAVGFGGHATCCHARFSLLQHAFIVRNSCYRFMVAIFSEENVT